jgi:hypothetical protein
MRHSPYPSEYQAVEFMTDNQRLDYFMSRVFEAEEVWFLHCKKDLFIRSVDGANAFVAWPYKIFATEGAIEYWHDCVPTACSLEFFLEQTLQNLINRAISIDIMPRGDKPGCIIAPQKLRSILNGMIDAGEYRLDG